MRRAAIVAPVRTAVGAFGGALRSVGVEHLGAAVIQTVLQRSGLDPAQVEDVVMAQSYPSGEAPCIGRWAALQAGLPVEVPGMQLDRRCGGGLQAIVTAAMMVQSGAADVVLAGGVESMSNVEYYSTEMRWGARSGSVSMHDRLQRARERSQPVERFGVISGMIAGRFDREIVPVPVTQKKGPPIIFARDEGVRGESTAESLAGLKPIIAGGTVTAGNAAQQNDAAAACLVVAEERLGALQLAPMAWPVGWAAAGCASWRRCCTNLNGARAATGSRPCASVVARAWQRYSSVPHERT